MLNNVFKVMCAFEAELPSFIYNFSILTPKNQYFGHKRKSVFS